MAASMIGEVVNEISPQHQTKFSHKRYRAQHKKMRRKKIRQTLALCREKISEERSESAYVIAERLANEELIKEKEKQERERLYSEWLLREQTAQREFKMRMLKEDQTKREREDKEKQIREEWELLQKKDAEMKKRLESEAQEKKDRQAVLLKEATENASEGPWNNPTAPADYGSELDKLNCPFFVKTGACRFGERCSRIHPRLPGSRTLLIPGMFSHFGMDKSHRDEYDSDMGLEYDDKDCYQHFKEFSDDVLPEFKRAGKVVQFKVCRNFEPHLRGNVYVQFEKEEDAMTAFKMFNCRFYAGKQLSCEFTSITKWKSAICGLFQYNRCPKGRNCNFLHVFNDSDGEFFDADRDVSPTRPNSDIRRYHGGHSRRQSSRSNRRSRSPNASHKRRNSRESEGSSYSRRSSRVSASRRFSRSRSRSRTRDRQKSGRSDISRRHRRSRSRSDDERHHRDESDTNKKSQKTSNSNGDDKEPKSISESEGTTHSEQKHKKSSRKSRSSSYTAAMKHKALKYPLGNMDNL